MDIKTNMAIKNPLQYFLEKLHHELLQIKDGVVASYIPELSHANPEWFGIAIATVDGHVYQVGDTRQSFTIQSISKVLTYGLSLEHNGIDAVRSKIDVEPSGETFNSISLEPNSGRPLNPMINAGAIATTGMVHGNSHSMRLQVILDTFERYTGHPVTVDEAVYLSEKTTGHRNRGIACLLQDFGILEDNVDDTLDLYFRQCSISVSCRDLAVTAACLANNGVNPVTGVVALDKRHVDKVLSVMGSCGMYDYSGNWLYNVGMPAKSGVGGGIMAVLPGQLGIGVFSPPLDEHGNSCRGIKACERISKEFGLHLYDTVRSTSASVLRVEYDTTQIRSRKQRPEHEEEIIINNGSCIGVYELQGELKFSSTESVISDLLEKVSTRKYIILDFRRTVEIDRSSQLLLVELIKAVKDSHMIFFTGLNAHYAFKRFLTKNKALKDIDTILKFQDTDHAIEWCEDRLLEAEGVAVNDDKLIDLDQHDLCAGLSSSELSLLQEQVTEVQFNSGDIVFRYGDPGDSMYFITKGAFEVILHLDSKHERRLTTLSAGTTFGELALLNQNRRAAEVRAQKDSLCLQLKFDKLGPIITTRLVANLANKLAKKLEWDAVEIMKLS